MNPTFSEVILRLGKTRPEYLFLHPFAGRVSIPEREAQKDPKLFGPDSGAGVFEELLLLLSDRLLDQCAKTWATLMHAEKKSGALTGETPTARFNSFIEKLKDPEYQNQVFHYFPVLSIQADKTIRHWEVFCLQFIQNLSFDFEAIINTFFDGEYPGYLKSIQYGLSDPHQGEKTVLILSFSKGKKVVYKPKEFRCRSSLSRLSGVAQWSTG